jgi:hypothetical protein
MVRTRLAHVERRILNHHNAVDSLRSLFLALSDECANPQSSLQRLPPARSGELATRLCDCRRDSQSVKKVLHRYHFLKTNDPRFRDKIAFTTGKQTVLLQRLAAHGTRLQQFLSGVRVATFSKIERNIEEHLLPLLKLRARLDQIHRDILTGRRDSVTLDDVDRVVAVEDKVLDDHMTEMGVDISHKVHDWVERVRAESSLMANEPELASGLLEVSAKLPTTAGSSPLPTNDGMPYYHGLTRSAFFQESRNQGSNDELVVPRDAGSRHIDLAPATTRKGNGNTASAIGASSSRTSLGLSCDTPTTSL